MDRGPTGDGAAWVSRYPGAMGLLSRVKARLSGKKSPVGIGAGFARSYEEEWNELVEQVDNYGQKVGAAIVQSWEVGAAELGRAAFRRGDLDPAAQKVLIERFSDALVPTLTPFQDLHKKTSVAMKAGFARGSSSGQIAQANSELLGLVAGLGESGDAGWAKSVEYLGPMFDLCADPDAARAAMRRHGEGVRAACTAAEAVLAAELAQAPGRASLWVAVTEPFDRWQLKLVRELEITITAASRELVAALASPTATVRTR